MCCERQLLRDQGVFMAVDEALKAFGQWLFGECMNIHAMSRACHHSDGLVRFTDGADDMVGHIIGIMKPSTKVLETHIHESVALDVTLLDRVFKAPIVTVKSIPHSCRLAFSQTLKTTLYNVVAQPGSVKAWVSLLLLPRCTLQVFRSKNRHESRSGNRRALQHRSILDSLCTWEKEDGIAMLVKDLLASFGLGSWGQGGMEIHEEKNCGDTNIRQCLRKVVGGHFTIAVKVLCSSGVAPYNSVTMRALKSKHPHMQPPSMPSTIYSESPLVATVDSVVLGCIKSFPKGTSCGRDGLTAQYILDALCGDGFPVATDLLCAITAVVNLWLEGRCPSSVAEFVASAPLTPLLKPDNGIRPIALGTIWKRLVSKVAMKGVGKDMAKYLNDFQFGVGE